MATPEERFARLIEAAREDPDVAGVALFGSRGKGFATAESDYDALVVLRDGVSGERRHYWDEQADAGIELWVVTLGEFARHAASWGREFAWAEVWLERYCFTNADVLVDKTGGLGPLIELKGRVPEELRVPLVREALDAYVNSFYRSLKCLRNGNRMGARLEAADSIGYALAVIYGLEGRHRPYYSYLELELRAYPLRTFPISGDELLGLIGAIVEGGDAASQQRLFAVIDPVVRAAGCGDVLAGWGDKYDWMVGFRGE